MKTQKKNNEVLRMVLSSLFLALAFIMPYITGQIPEIGSMLCPMHIPVLLCGFICGWKWGLVVGFASPLLRSFIVGMPPMFPTALCMAFELAVYGSLSGITRALLPKKKPYIYVSLLIAMIGGRIVWGIATAISLTVTKSPFGFSAFITGAFTNALPGIAVQIILVPIVVMVFDKIKLFKE